MTETWRITRLGVGEVYCKKMGASKGISYAILVAKNLIEGMLSTWEMKFEGRKKDPETADWRDFFRFTARDAELLYIIEKGLAEDLGLKTGVLTNGECDECWGTGHTMGFGAPCSRGCKPPKKRFGLEHHESGRHTSKTPNIKEVERAPATGGQYYIDQQCKANVCNAPEPVEVGQVWRSPHNTTFTYRVTSVEPSAVEVEVVTVGESHGVVYEIGNMSGWSRVS